MLLSNNKAFKEGKAAKRANKGTADSPYERDTPEWRRWFAGWMVANVNWETNAESPAEGRTPCDLHEYR